MDTSNQTVIVVDTSPIFGGAQRSLLTTLKGLASHNLNSLVVSGCSQLTEALKDAGIPVVPFPFKLWKRSLNGVIHAGSDIMHFKGFLSGLSLSGDVTFYANGLQSGLLLAVSLPRKTRLIVHHRDILCPDIALKKVVKRADVNIVLTQFMAQNLINRVGERWAPAFRCVYNGFDVDHLQALSQENPETELPNDRLIVTFVADLVPWKRHDLFIDAMALAAETEPALYGLIIGGVREPSGEGYRSTLIAQVKNASREQDIAFAGALTNPMPVIKRSHVMCALSDNEPFGRTVIEAASVGTPMVVREPGGPAELVAGLPGCLTVNDNPEIIAEAIVTASKESRYDVSDAWKQRFTVETHCKTIFEILKS